MKLRIPITHRSAAGGIRRILIVMMTILGSALTMQCTQPHDHTQEAAKLEATRYVCPMHPQVTSDKPGQCPICGMDLVLAGSGDLMLTPAQERLANIHVQRVSSGSITDGTLINARLAANEDRRVTISSRAAGRIERLYARETGQPIAAGQPLYELYSESLVGQIQEYLMLKDQYDRLGQNRERYLSLLKSAEQKLIRYGLTSTQIGKFNSTTSRVTFLAPASGTISEVMATEGQYVDEGMLMYRLDRLEKIWLEAEIYPHEVATIKLGDVVPVDIPAANRTLNATISFITPAYRENSQLVIIRATLDNPNGTLIPGMQATIRRQGSASAVMQVPLDAVIRTGKGAYAFVQTDPHTYAVRSVKTGAESAKSIEITDGLRAEDEVVIRGAYLLYSEMVLKMGTSLIAHEHH